MDKKDYSLILDSLEATGIYVIKEDTHEILYFNQKVKDLLPDAKTGVICHELWKGSCSCCPLIGMGDKKTNHSFNYDGPNHKPTDIKATRVLWEDSVPAVIVTFSPHTETYSPAYEKIVKGNLTTNTCEAVKMLKAERDMLPPEGFTLTMALESFMQGGFLYHEDIEKFKKFSDLSAMSRAFKEGKTYLVCNYRRNTQRGLRWNTMEVVPDSDYTHEDQSIMIYVKDVQDIYSEGLEHEALNIKNEAILKALGKENFGIYLVNLSTGQMDCIRAAKEDQEYLSVKNRNWEDALSWLLENRYHADYREKFKKKFNLQALAGLGGQNKKKQEMLLERRIGGAWRYVNASAHYHRDFEGNGYAILAFQDVDEHIRKELGYIQDEKRMAAALRAGYSQIKFINLETGSCEHMSFGEDETAATEDYNDYFTRVVAEKVCAEDKDGFLTALSLESLRRKAKNAGEYKEEVFQYRAGERPPYQWMEQHIFYIRQENGTEVGVFGRDISETKRREEEEKRSAREKVHIINSLSSMFFSTGYVDLESGTVRRIVQRENVAEALGDKYGYTDVIEHYAAHFVHPDDREAYCKTVGYPSILENLSEKRPILACEFRETEEDGKENRWIRASIVLAESENGKPTAALYVAQDITESKLKEIKDRHILQDALETANFANTAKSEFLSRMSHDIRTPMNAILGMAAIAGTHLNDAQRVSDCLGKITVSGRHLLSLINEVLDLSKIESGRVDLSEEEFELSAFVDELMTVILPTAHAKQQSLTCRQFDIKHERVIGDALRLQQVFINLLSNSVKYTPALGKIELEIREETSVLNGYGHYEFVVRDNGIGMSEEYMKHIFEPFSRDEKMENGNIEGTGLGMPIARNIVQMMNGDISIKSAPGKGSEFTVTLFLKIGDTDNAVIKELIDLPVLVADDDEDSCETACHILGEIGMKGEWVLSGAEAVVRVTEAHEKEKDYYAVILDWQMPGMDGIETAKRIRSVVGPDIPIIILSAYDWAEVEEEAKSVGINGFISKPLFKSRLLYLFRQFAEGDKEDDGQDGGLKEVGEHHYAGRRILLAEDNDLNREIAVEIIGMTGVEIECATNGKEALEMFASSPKDYYDLIFMDIRMPVMNGYEATQAIRKLDRDDAGRIPIVAMSANAFTSDMNASRQAGMNEHIIKPLNFKILTTCMDKWLNRDKGGCDED